MRVRVVSPESLESYPSHWTWASFNAKRKRSFMVYAEYPVVLDIAGILFLYKLSLYAYLFMERSSNSEYLLISL